MNQDITLAELVAACTRCRLATERTGLTVPALPGSLYTTRGLAIFCEAPGADEEKLFTQLPSGVGIGKPLVGRSGQFLDQLLKLAGTSREEVVVLNRIRCRPERNRIMDYPDAVTQCDDWVIKELQTYDPKVVVLCGNTALKALYGASINITASRGTLRQTSAGHAYGSRLFLPTFHPAYLLRSGALSSPLLNTVVEDLKLAVSLL